MTDDHNDETLDPNDPLERRKARWRKSTKDMNREELVAEVEALRTHIKCLRVLYFDLKAKFAMIKHSMRGIVLIALSDAERREILSRSNVIAGIEP